MSRELRTVEVIEELLESYRDVADQLRRSRDLAYSGQLDSVALEMGQLWREGSYPLLEQALLELRDAEPRVYWHVRERYITPATRIIVGCPVCRQATDRRHEHFDGKVRKKFEPQRVSVKVCSVRVSPELVVAGLRWLEDWFVGNGLVPYLPREIFEGLAA